MTTASPTEPITPIDGVSVVYLSGPMSRIPEFNYPAFMAAAAGLREAGYLVYNPAENDLDTTGLNGTEKVPGFDLRAAFADYAAHITTDANAIAVLPGWENSPGAKGEVALALAIGLPVLDAVTGQRLDATFTVTSTPYVEPDPERAAAIARHPAGKATGTPETVEETVERIETPAALSLVGRHIEPDPLPIIIGLSGYAQTGKDTVGDIFVEQHGYRLVSPSNVLREFIYAQDLYIPAPKRWFERGPRAVSLCAVVDAHGWDEARILYPYIRTLQQKTGTEAGREVLHYNVWLDAMKDRFVEGDRHVSTSVRFLNEAQAVVDMDGVIIRVNRPGVGPVNAHGSDIEMDAWKCDYVIENDGSLDDLRRKVEGVIESIRSSRAA